MRLIRRLPTGQIADRRRGGGGQKVVAGPAQDPLGREKGGRRKAGS
jgi:hypothetical protein